MVCYTAEQTLLIESYLSHNGKHYFCIYEKSNHNFMKMELDLYLSSC